jgi:hypothetical protein
MFGHPMLGDGWQTDMGQIYIILGAPQNPADAAKWFGLAVDAVPPYEQGVPRLVSLLAQQQKYTELAHKARAAELEARAKTL